MTTSRPDATPARPMPARPIPARPMPARHEPTPRVSTWRQQLFAATMLVPVVTIGVLAVGRITLRHVPFGGLVETALAQSVGPQGGSQAVPRGSMPPSLPNTAPPQSSPVVAGTPSSTKVTTPESGSPAVSVLLEQANFWRKKLEYDQAIASLNRALVLEPHNAQALALLGLIDADRGNRAEAQAVLTRLRTAAPGDPGIDAIEQSLRIGAISPDALAEARKLAADKQEAQSVQRYNNLFHGNPPPDRLAVEYYQTLAGTEGGWEQARDGLARVVQRNPDDLDAQLAYAQILTYRDGSRGDGLARLAVLARNPSVAERATQAWRQALDWLPTDKSAVDPITVYLKSHPNDVPMENKLQAARTGTGAASTDPATNDRIGGFDALNRNRLGDAIRDFQQSIDANPNDADALGGLGIVRLRQRNYGEARSLLSRAIALDPDHRDRWQQALDAAIRAGRGYGGGRGRGGGGENQAARAQALLNRGEYAAAEAELKRQIARNIDRSGGLQSMLADAQAQQGRLGDAEASYRDALARNPRNTGAILGLAGILSREGRSDEAQRMLAQAESSGAGRQVGQARALALREQAQEVQDPATQAALFREAVSSDPTNPWLRLDLARSLVKTGQVGEARSVMAQITSNRNPSLDTLKAGIIFANETHDPDTAAALIQRLPASARTADMRVLQAQASMQREVGAALNLPHAQATQRLLAMAAQPDPDGARGPAIARALNSIGEKAAARQALLMSRGTSTNASASARLAYAGAFMDIGDSADADQTLRQVGSGTGLTSQERQDYAQLRAGLAVQTSDQLNQRGRQADAYDVLAPALATSPTNPDLNLALGRLYQGARDPKQALAIDEALLRRDPNNDAARRAAVEAAMQAGDRARADQLVQETLRVRPNDPQAWIAAAEVAKARGENGRALQDYQRARDLRLQQLGYGDSGAYASAVPPGVSLVPGAPASYAPTSPRAAPAVPGARPLYQTPFANPDGGEDDSTLPPGATSSGAPPASAPAAAAEPPPSSVPPNLYPEGVAPATSQGAVPAGTAPPNYAIPHGRMLDTTGNDLPTPAIPAATAQAPGTSAGVTSAGVTPAASPAVPLAPAAPRATPVATAPIPPATPPAATVTAEPLAPAAAAPAAPLATPAQYTPRAYQPAQYQPAQYQPAQYQPVQYQAAPYQTPQDPYSTPQYQPGPNPFPPPAALAPAPYRAAAPAALAPAPMVTAAGPGYYSNPFRTAPGTLDTGPAMSASPPDAVTAEIDRNISALRDEVAPALQAGLGFRARSGDAGLDRLTEFTVPLQAEFSPGGQGRLTLEVTPTTLEAGRVNGFGTTSPTNVGRFGTDALFLHPGTAATAFNSTYTGVSPADQNATGVGLGASFAFGTVTADVGSTPLGFRLENVVGGVQWVPALGPYARLRLTAEQRAVDDSLLSYGGTVDPNTGVKWGGEVRDRGHANLEFSAGLANFYVGAGGGEVRGTHVPTNADWEAGAGGSYPVYRATGQELRLGLDLVYLGYSKNLDYFSLGQGGYFSPQSYAAALVPVTWKETVDEDLNYEVGVSLGIQTFHESSSPVYPEDPLLQAALVAQQSSPGTAVPGQVTNYASQNQTGFAGSGHAAVDYRVAPNFHIGGKVGVQHSGNWTEGTGLVYARYLFNGTAAQ